MSRFIGFTLFAKTLFWSAGLKGLNEGRDNEKKMQHISSPLAAM